MDYVPTLSQPKFSLEEALKIAPLRPLSEIWDYLRNISPDDLRKYASQLQAPVQASLLVTASELERGSIMTKYCSYLDQHIDFIHDWHSAQSEHNDLN